MSGRTVDVTTYLHVGPDGRSYYGYRIHKHSNAKPDEPAPGCVVVKVRIRLPEAAFQPLSPEAIIDVPLELVQRPVEVTAEDAAS